MIVTIAFYQSTMPVELADPDLLPPIMTLTIGKTLCYVGPPKDVTYVRLRHDDQVIAQGPPLELGLDFSRIEAERTYRIETIELD